MNKLAEQVKNIISNQCGLIPERIPLDSKLVDNLGMDSLDLAAMVAGLEKELGIQIPNADALRLSTVNDVILYCTAKVEGK